MSTELVIDSSQNGSRIALLKDKNLVEIHSEGGENQFKVGDIYLGTVRKIVNGLNAAFIDVGYEKDAFLHYQDLGPQINSLNKFIKLVRNNNYPNHNLKGFEREPDIEKLGKISTVLTKGNQVLVQVVKEPISTKGPRLSCELSIAGRYLVLVPFSDTVNVSKKIRSAEERKRLVRLITSIKPANFGVIIRTVAEGQSVTELDKDLRNLLTTWEEGMKKLLKAKGRDKVIGEMSMASSIIRDLLNESFDAITVEDELVYDQIRSYIRSIAPEKEKIVKLYNGKAKLFESFGIEKQIKSLFGQTISLPQGGYLIIEHTEALHVIDVNSGNKSNQESDQETTALKTNLVAAKEIARQLRLRDMGGIIVIDFIDMKKAENKKAIYDAMRDVMKDDRSKHTVLPLSKFGLMQITRQRVRPEVNIVTKETCPACNGTGKIQASILVADQLEKDLEHMVTIQNVSKIHIGLHPYLYAYFTHGLISKRVNWFFKYFKWVRLIKDSSLPVTEYKFLDDAGEEIELQVKSEAE
ncbi:Cytoplasmic axial filament protein CafA and Ribonuclease G [Mariniradius saccharolyticus AK6]|uniref:Cytoplasmic axial filament protein CafA and Ribonuclease G n=1 Tax=Mariniradius saccharolyticus AK6 TaxID=1239962 RepID=M7X0W7_9BACT|nr:Rne/Rng family ribonuclease [Mariniradius saccharolyticus]EMS31175.1 Cytoplasmic axial filament protein CafA and Ribonuclease G [Mariniradius saccharolyticus AK6]